jgi:L-threonylcarbamoyladenylate synthase
MKTPILNQIEVASQLLKKGELIAMPTETVYGLAAPIFNVEAILKIFTVKKRPADNPLIAHLSSIEELERIAIEIPDDVFRLMESFSPGPLTCVVKKHPQVPTLVSKETIAFRIPAHEMARELIRLTGSPLVAPSANLSGRPSPTCPAHVLEDLDGQIAGVLDGGPCQVGIESTVISLLDPLKPLLLRPGSIEREEIEEVLKKKVFFPTGDQPCHSPGMKYRHYSPDAKVFLFDTFAQLQAHVLNSEIKRKIAIPTTATLYAILRQADLDKCEEVCFLCESLPEGLQERLKRASSQ